jgi:hypothetical protein
MKVEQVYFFGNVLGIRSDYYVAFSTVVDPWLPSVRYCSQDCVVWSSLMETPSEGSDKGATLDVPFTGSLINEFMLPSGRIITEEQRLSAVLSDMAKQCAIIPRECVLQTALNAVLKNPMWVGYPIHPYMKVSNLRH